jgi:cytoskeletal protein CcmA (bactofilin family)
MTPPYPPGLLSKPAENGAGSPTYRPAALKDQPMGRTPFATSPTAAPNSPQPNPSASPIRPTGLATASPRPVGAPELAERRTLVVGRGISVQGTVQDAERLVVEGTVEASMIHATELSISHGGVFKGEAEVEEAEVAGTIDGTLTARANLIIRATGKVIGTAKYRRLQVEDGGQISGKMEMLTEVPKPVESAA